MSLLVGNVRMVAHLHAGEKWPVEHRRLPIE